MEIGMKRIKQLFSIEGRNVYLVERDEKHPRLVAAALMNRDEIVVSKLFYEIFTEETQQAVLFHEVGHLNFHKGVPKTEENYLERECEADYFAATKTDYSKVLLIHEQGMQYFKELYEKKQITKLEYEQSTDNLKHRFGYICDQFIFGC